ncbi:hypothetical protein [Desulfobacter sp.]|uniref:hypothetical protein n=1 Tax=Desulfobacter sp. TaxID=2294 RepID=UPI000E8EFCE1|nr:hypothetical protein [Desulfobacter sp.]HBT86910.1 hypothetical protein [Desulfobacter sp.]
MFNFFKKNCDFHIDQMDKCLKKAFESYSRADSYLSGSGFGDGITKNMSAQGAIAKGQEKIKEAFWNFQDGVKDISNENDEIGLKTVLLKYTTALLSLRAMSLIQNDAIIDILQEDMDLLEAECKKLINFGDS